MTGPFDDEDILYVVLQNHELQYSLWPAHMRKPDGWNVIVGPATRGECVESVEKSWVDMRPASLVRMMDNDAV